MYLTCAHMSVLFCLWVPISKYMCVPLHVCHALCIKEHIYIHSSHFEWGLSRLISTLLCIEGHLSAAFLAGQNPETLVGCGSAATGRRMNTQRWTTPGFSQDFQVLKRILPFCKASISWRQITAVFILV